MNTNASLEDHGGKSHRESGIVGGIVQGILSFAAAVVGGSCAVLSLGVHTRLSGYAWKASRYWMGNSGWNRQIVDPFVALLMGAIVFARLSFEEEGAASRPAHLFPSLLARVAAWRDRSASIISLRAFMASARAFL